MIGCRTSATNCARLYNASLANTDVTRHVDWPFSFTVSDEHVWDAFVILALLEDCKRRSTLLTVPHTGLQKDRFTEAISARNIRFRLHGQPELRHFCHRCLRVYPDGRKVWVVVIDGVTVGHPCCAVHNCKVPLANSRHHRFCPIHASRGTICAVHGCELPVRPGFLTCDHEEHQKVEKIHRERGQARFQLQERLQRARVAHPKDSLPSTDTPISDLVDVDDEDEEFEVGNQAVPGPSSTTKRIRAQFGHRRTHNEQIIVAPCGMIIARETFYGAEGCGSVIVMCPSNFGSLLDC